MPHDYESLKNHVSATHPEILDAFVGGWNELDPDLQHCWRKQGMIEPRVKVESNAWLSWTTFKLEMLFESKAEDYPFDKPLSTYMKRLGILFHNSMEHSGDIFRFPYMPHLNCRTYSSPDNSCRSATERHAIAKDAAKSVIHTELRKMLIKWKKDLDENGI